MIMPPPLGRLLCNRLPGNGTLLNGKWLKRAPGAAQKRDRSSLSHLILGKFIKGYSNFGSGITCLQN
ncbi:hypothetical protein ROLI_040290 [Roseobacter fucihabitans]|uniref:Uncharacterized protein n=1 Tax=Roseobacter fucihabitans TaxID=1537242 RepID=A0ABZ2BY43_9RHOB|nr:hypothetical protein [Roseobacter litoralis]